MRGATILFPPYAFMARCSVKKHMDNFSFTVIICSSLDDRGSRVRFPSEAGNFSPHHRLQNGSGAHPASYPMGTRVSFPGGKAAEA
jgi:hypothetical protein